MRIIERKEVRRDDPVEYFSPRGSEVSLESKKEMKAVEVPLNEEISGGGKNGGRKIVGSAIRRRRANGGSVHIKKRQRGGVVYRDVDPCMIRVGIKQREREEVESLEKDKPCLTKMVTPPLACIAS